MNTQQLLTMGGLMIFSLASLSFTTSSFNQRNANYFNEAAFIASSVGKSIVDEIHSKAFDEKTVTKAVNNTSDLTPSGSLYFESGEGINNYNGYYKTHGYDASTSFDDIDDYNGFIRDYSNQKFDNFNLSVKVFYVDPNNPSNVSSIQTFAKKIEVTISNPYLSIQPDDSTGSLILSSIITY